MVYALPDKPGRDYQKLGRKKIKDQVTLITYLVYHGAVLLKLL